MFIQTEATPNPNSLKFIPDGIEIAAEKPIEFKNKKQAISSSKLAEQIFAVDGVKGILFGKDFITINKDDSKDWSEIKTEILATLVDFFVSGKPIFKDKKLQELNEKQEDKKTNDEDEDVVKQIKELIEIKVRPAVAMDGGDIIYRDFKDGVVYLVLKGSCSGCPSSTITLKNGIENMLKHYVPEVLEVEQIFDDEF